MKPTIYRDPVQQYQTWLENAGMVPVPHVPIPVTEQK